MEQANNRPPILSVEELRQLSPEERVQVLEDAQTELVSGEVDVQPAIIEVEKELGDKKEVSEVSFDPNALHPEDPTVLRDRSLGIVKAYPEKKEEEEEE